MSSRLLFFSHLILWLESHLPKAFQPNIVKTILHQFWPTIATGKYKWIQTKWIFKQFPVGFVRDIPLNSRGQAAIGLGIGYAYNQLISNLHFESMGNNAIFLMQKKPPNLFFFNFSSVFRFRTSLPDKTDFWRVYFRLKYQIKFSEHYHPFYIKPFDSNFIRKNNTSIFLSMGYNTWNMFVESISILFTSPLLSLAMDPI